MGIFSKITASNYILPKQVLTNEELFERFDPKKVKGISKLSGIYERRIAPKEITSVDLGTEAAKRMIENLGIEKDSFDMLIFVTQTPDYIMPASAFIVHERLGLPQNCGAFDISMGCAAMPYGISVANGLISSGQCKKILLIFADTVTKLVYPKDRSLVTLHGDGAAAFIIEKTNENFGIESTEIFSDSTGWKHLIVPDGGWRNPISEKSREEKIDETGIITTDASLQMNGVAVFHFSISKIPVAIESFLKNKNEKLSDYKLVLLHQANKMMLDTIYNSIDATDEQRFTYMENIGNLSVASTPVVLAEAIRQQKLKDGGKVLFASFGVGLTWGIGSISFAPDSVKSPDTSIEF